MISTSRLVHAPRRADVDLTGVVRADGDSMELAAELSTMSFDDACRAVVAVLKRSAPLASWSVTQRRGDQQVVLTVLDDVYGLADGSSRPWSESLCEHLLTGAAPAVVLDVREITPCPQTIAGKPVRSYAGVAIVGRDGRVFGTICGYDPQVQPPGFADHAPLLALFSALLGQIMEADLLREQGQAREAELRWRAFHDPLTGLANRAYFLERIERAVQQRRADPSPLAVLLLDLDDFKTVNDTLGHAAGDQLLIAVAERVQLVIRTGDTLVRLSGDEFAVIVDTGDDPVRTAERIVRGLEQPFTIDGAELLVGGTVGVAELPLADRSVDADTLMQQADIAMYSAKRGGKSQVARYEPAMTLPDGKDLRLREPLRRAIAAGDVVLHFQPIVDLVTEQIAGLESLARWSHDGRIVSPDVFIPVAARSGLLPALTELVLDQACSQLARWSVEAPEREVRVGINVPPGALTDLGFPDLVAGALARHGVDAWQLVLEITEDALVTDIATSKIVTRRLQEIGTALSLDDFGTGYSSLLHLREIPFATFKIDRGFIEDVDTDPEARRFVGALLALGRDLGVEVVAEGVERAAQAEVLRALGCRFVQGWYFGRPAPGAEVRWEVAEPGSHREG